MNAIGRKEIERISTRLSELQEEISTLKEELESVKDEEESKYDNLPENFQEGERGCKMQEIIDNLDSAFESLEEIDNNIESAVSSLQEACE